MFALRSLRWPADRELLLSFDTSFSTDRVYRIRTSAYSFVLEEQLLSSTLHKAYDLAADIGTLPDFDHVSIADVDSLVAGMAALKFERWNQRAVLTHIYVHPNYRRQGIGNALISDAIQVAQSWRARCVWLETQNVNFPAIQFYQRLGFQWCGLDMALYDGAEAAAGEVALFFTRPMAADGRAPGAPLEARRSVQRRRATQHDTERHSAPRRRACARQHRA